MIVKYGVWVTPPAAAGLEPRFQIWYKNGVCEIVEYDSEEEANIWQRECSSCTITKMKYEVRIVRVVKE